MRFLRGTTAWSVSLSWGAREVGSPCEGDRERIIALESWWGICPRDVLKKVSRGLSRVEAGNPGFPRLVQVTSGASHGGSEKPGKLEVGGASRDSTGFGALEEGLISS